MKTLREVSMMVLYYLLTQDPKGFKQKIRRDPNELYSSYDFIIVGGGSSGSVLANRLSEIKEWKILLIEAGGEENSFSKTPAMYYSHFNTRFDWNFTTSEQKYACLATNGFCSFPRGKILGGTSSVDAMIYTRGYKSDYDKWGSMGNKDWCFKEIEKYFIKIENVTGTNVPNRGRNGPLSIGYPPYRANIADDFIISGLSQGLVYGECEDNEKNCIEDTLNTIKNGSRCSAAEAYLTPVISRPNLHILKNAFVTKIIIENKKAKGVVVLHKKKEYKIFTKLEILISAGSISSPKLLMLSGIGPKDHLNELGIHVESDLPVGKNLQDHARVPVWMEVDTKELIGLDRLNKPALEEYVEIKKGPFTSTGIDALAFVKLGKNVRSSDLPNVKYHISSLVGYPHKHLIAITTTVLKPKSRGTVLLRSSNPLEHPLIDPNYFADPDDFELALEGLRFSLKLFANKEFQKYKPKIFKEHHPYCSKAYKDGYLKCIIRYYSLTNYHSVGTNGIGYVVNNKFCVKNIKNLRVIDSSIAPMLISGNTNSMALMLGEKGSDIIKKCYGKI